MYVSVYPPGYGDLSIFKSSGWACPAALDAFASFSQGDPWFRSGTAPLRGTPIAGNSIYNKGKSYENAMKMYGKIMENHGKTIYNRGNSIYKWRMTGGTPISKNHKKPPYIYNMKKKIIWDRCGKH
jgi:hypothetical protein